MDLGHAAPASSSPWSAAGRGALVTLPAVWLRPAAGQPQKMSRLPGAGGPVTPSEPAQSAELERLNRMADAIAHVCGWLPLSVRYEAAQAALARIAVFGSTCPWCGCVGYHTEVCEGFEVNDPARTDGQVAP